MEKKMKTTIVFRAFRMSGVQGPQANLSKVNLIQLQRNPQDSFIMITSHEEEACEAKNSASRTWA